ncbi:hypothetical protein GCM10020220_003940 [Nonomuraea rubra]|uniref:hypothetical protein n=1 Tax=Nonomuraea rubra TaxID=46180 RepID=UPI00337CE98E
MSAETSSTPCSRKTRPGSRLAMPSDRPPTTASRPTTQTGWVPECQVVHVLSTVIATPPAASSASGVTSRSSRRSAELRRYEPSTAGKTGSRTEYIHMLPVSAIPGSAMLNAVAKIAAATAAAVARTVER